MKLRADVTLEYGDENLTLVDARLERRIHLGPRGAAFVHGKPDEAIARRLLLLALYDEELPARSHDRVQLDGARFECQGSGACCRSQLLGPITDDERARLDALMGPGPHVEDRDGKLYLVRDALGRCKFLVDDRRCGVHAAHGAAAKPAICRMFPVEIVPTILGARVADRGMCASFPVSARAGLPLIDQIAPDLPPQPLYHPAVILGDTTIDFAYWLRVTDAAIARLETHGTGRTLRWLLDVIGALDRELGAVPFEPGEPSRTIARVLASERPVEPGDGSGGEVATLVLDELAEIAREADVFGPLGAEIASMLAETSRSLLEDPPRTRLDDAAHRLSARQQLFGRRALVAERARPALLRLALLQLCAARAPRGHELFTRLLELGAAQSVLLQHDELAAPIVDALPDLLAEPA